MLRNRGGESRFPRCFFSIASSFSSKLIPLLVNALKPGGFLVEYHGCEWLASCKIDLVLVLQTETGKIKRKFKDIRIVFYMLNSSTL